MAETTVLVPGFPDGDGSAVPVAPDKPVPNGGKLFRAGAMRYGL